MLLKEINSEVFVADEPIVEIGPHEVAFLKDKLPRAPRGRVRLCAHSSNADLLHEMFIALAKTTYVRPHRHLAKSESFHIVEGLVDVVILDERGGIVEIIELGDAATGRNFYYRLSSPAFHTLLIRSDILIIHETTNGPFRQEDAMVADWAPSEADLPTSRDYMVRLDESASKFQRAKQERMRCQT
jgi:cupin fold WbuC family metalloprotein